MLRGGCKNIIGVRLKLDSARWRVRRADRIGVPSCVDGRDPRETASRRKASEATRQKRYAPWKTPRALALEHQLHVNHVQPASELVADLLEAADVLEAEPFVQRDAGGLIAVDAGDDVSMIKRTGAIDQVLQDQAADALAMIVVMDVDGVFDR